MTLTQNYKFENFCSKTEILSTLYEIWQSQQIEHANYEHNTRQCLSTCVIIGSEWLKGQNDYRL